MACSWMLEGLFQPRDTAASASCLQMPSCTKASMAVLVSASDRLASWLPCPMAAGVCFLE